MNHGGYGPFFIACTYRLQSVYGTLMFNSSLRGPPPQTMNGNELNIDKRDIADRAVDAITDGFSSYGYLTSASTDERIHEAILEELQRAELTRLT